MKRIIIKVGTGVLTRESDGQLDGSSLVKLVTAIADISNNGYKVILVSSGAVGALECRWWNGRTRIGPAKQGMMPVPGCSYKGTRGFPDGFLRNDEE